MHIPDPIPQLPAVPDPYGTGLITLTAYRSTGHWAKKHAGRRYYFAPLNDPDKAIAEYIRLWPGIIEPETQADRSTATIVDAMTEYFDHCDRRVRSGELTAGRVISYKTVLRKIIDFFGGRRGLASIPPTEWEKAIDGCFGGYTPVTKQVAIQSVRTALGWCERNLGATATTGDALRPVPARVRRKHLRLKGPQLVTPGQVRRMIKAARSLEGDGRTDWELTEATIWLAINAGMRQSDVAQLTPAAYRPARRVADGVRGWIDEPRVKTEAPRRFPLWPETADAIDRALAVRTSPEWLFCRPNGRELIIGRDDLLGKRIKRVRERAWPDPASRWRASNLDRFRKTFITVAKGARVDPPDMSGAVRRTIAGHITEDVHESYTQELPDAPFIQVVLHVRHWLLRS